MRKLLIIALFSVLALLLAGCGRKEDASIIGGADSPQSIELSDKQNELDKVWNMWEEGKVASPYAELMTYQSEINNGGHDQYFLNVGNTGDLQKEMAALDTVLSEKLKGNLQAAYQAYLLLEENENDEKAEETIEQCDNVFYENETEINSLLEEYATKMMH